MVSCGPGDCSCDKHLFGVMLVVAPLGLVALAVVIPPSVGGLSRFLSFLMAGLVSVAFVAYLLTSTSSLLGFPACVGAAAYCE